MLLDLGCGSGLSGEAISDAGHHWCGPGLAADRRVHLGGRCRVALTTPLPPPSQLPRVGLDISPSMLEVACERETDGDLLLSDLGQGVPVRPNTFDGAVSISAVQWLCNADKTGADPRLRLKARVVYFAA